jgi:drug/metabolite transporter (DMT)-like permease
MVNQNKSYLYAAVTILLWATVASAFKMALHSLNYIQLMAIASFTSTFIFLSIIIVSKKFFKIFEIQPADYLRSLLLGFINPFCYYLALFKSYSLIPAQIAQPINYTWPIIFTLLSVIFLGKKINKMMIFGLMVSFLGVLLISSQGSLSGFKNINISGVAVAFVSACIWSVYWILNLKSKVDSLILLFLNFFFSSVYISILLIYTGNFHSIEMKSLFPAIYIGCFEMGISFVLWMKALQYAKSPAIIGNVSFIIPFLSLLLIHFVLKEDIYITTFAGLGFIIAGIIINKSGEIKSAEKI